MVVLGESLAAGLVNFSLQEDDQRRAFPLLVARQLGVTCATPFFQPPGVGEATGFPSLPVLIPHEGQTTILTARPTEAEFDNLSIPGLSLAEAVERRPRAPLVQRDDPRGTALNFILGAPEMLTGSTTPIFSQLEYATRRQPGIAIIELGFAEAVDAAASGRLDRLPSDDQFRERYALLVSTMRGVGARVVTTTIPDPMDSAYCMPLDAAARVLRMPARELQRDYGLRAGDRILVSGLTEIGVQIMAKRASSLPAGSIVNAETAAAISARVAAFNAAIHSIAASNGAAVADFAALYRMVSTSALRAGSRVLTGDFLGGFFSLNGYTPGAAGQAALANLVIDAINTSQPQKVPSIDLAAVVESDAVANYWPAQGPAFRTAAGRFAAVGATLRLVMFLVGFVAKAIHGAATRKKERRPAAQGNDPRRWTLTLPPQMVQVLPINTEGSYYGDALRPVHTTSGTEQELGISGRLLFRGLALLDSHLYGKVRIKFFPPVNNIAHFEVTHPGGGLSADDGRLSAPVFFKLAAVGHKVMDSTSHVSSGDLNLVTGEVTNLQYQLFFLNSAILALAAVNPSLPKDPLAFPGRWGSTWARFDQRPDGLLDYTCYGTSFVPLSVLKAPIRFPLPFTGPSGSVASIPGDGTALHPHFRISTRSLAPARATEMHLPTNTIREMTTPAGRLQIQYGERFGNAVSVAVRRIPAAETIPAPSEPVVSDPATDDRLNLPVGVVDLRTGTLMPGGGSRLTTFGLTADAVAIAAAARVTAV